MEPKTVRWLKVRRALETASSARLVKVKGGWDLYVWQNLTYKGHTIEHLTMVRMAVRGSWTHYTGPTANESMAEGYVSLNREALGIFIEQPERIDAYTNGTSATSLEKGLAGSGLHVYYRGGLLMDVDVVHTIDNPADQPLYGALYLRTGKPTLSEPDEVWIVAPDGRTK